MYKPKLVKWFANTIRKEPLLFEPRDEKSCLQIIWESENTVQQVTSRDLIRDFAVPGFLSSVILYNLSSIIYNTSYNLSFIIYFFILHSLIIR